MTFIELIVILIAVQLILTQTENNMINRNETQEMKDLIKIQNEFYPNQDIMTITGFMNHEQFKTHVNRYKVSAYNKLVK